MYNEIASNRRRSVLLVMIFVALVVVVGWIFDRAQGGIGYGGVALGLFISLIMTLVSYFQGDKIALATTGAKPLAKREENRYVWNIVENLCIANGQPMPSVYIIEDAAINAFATGRDPQHASIALTTGAISKLDNQELEGVIAHELSHIKNYDIRFMMLVAVLVGAIVIMGDLFIHTRRFMGKESDRENSQAGMIFLVIGIAFAILAPLFGELIKLAISRRREYLADASGALLTRYPEGLASALEKIAEENQPMKTASTATAHLFISSPFAGSKWRNLFSTHPPVEERVKKLRTMGV